MTKKWMITENIIAALLLAWALFFLYSFTASTFSHISQGLQAGVVSKGEVSYVKMLGIYNVYYLCGLLSGYAGVAMLFEKKWGWLASVASCLIFMGFLFVSARDGFAAAAGAKTSHFSISYLIAGFVFAIMFVVLVLKPFRVKYKPGLPNWLAVGGIILLVLIDKKFVGH